MKDQVDALTTAGVPATFLNSSLSAADAAARLRGLDAGVYRLLYLAPERLAVPGTLEDLRRWGLRMIAVDEAHCISEWGHDFRPEYRQLAGLRAVFPGVPMMALTATATERVRADVLAQLQLRDARFYTASFNRPNLTYRVIAKQKPFDQVLQFVRGRSREAGIVYCQSRKSAESVAERLDAAGIRAKPYHAGLVGSERAHNQELFLRDEVQVICATIAFGMGINKPNVRYVIHYDLPKNVEGYYQETGRAGRDGLPGECLLLFSAGDVVKYGQFIDEKGDARERDVARNQLRQITHYAESSGCRRAQLLRYFGEEYGSADCGGCDNCLTPRATFDGTVEAQKLLSAVYRIREKSGFGTGLNHVVEVLTGAATDKIRRWGHDALSVYGIGRDRARTEWAVIGRELIRVGLLQQTPGKFSILELTAEGRDALNDRRQVVLTKPAAAPRAPEVRRNSGDIACDEELFERLRRLRKRLADARGVPAYIVFSDVSLRHMARECPTSAPEFLMINGVGEKKMAEFGGDFLAEIAVYRNGGE